MTVRKKLLVLGLVCFATIPGLGESFRFLYYEGDKYKVTSKVDEEVYVNNIFSHRADILNKISISVNEADNGTGLLEAKFQTSERSYGSHSVYQWAEDYLSVFRRGPFGRYDIEARYFMPVVRNVPLFPERDIKPGETWSFDGEEVHDLRANFGIPHAYHFPIKVGYQYLGKETLDGEEYDLISIGYTVFFKPPPIFDARLYPVRISGHSEQLLYWDSTAGRPYAYSEEFDFMFDLSSGDVVEYVGVAEARIVESMPLDREKMADEIRQKLEDSHVEDTDVRVSDEGVVVSLENIQFMPDSAILMQNEQIKLRIIAEILASFPERDILITGHTALAGTKQGRQRLSVERATVVGNFLLSLGAKSDEQVTIRGKGASEPVADNRTQEGMRKNRRVEITILEN